MLPSFVLALREGVEAALIVGILLGVLRKVQRPDLSLSIWWGVLCAAAASGLAAIGLTVAGASLEGPAEPVFEGAMMLLAAGLLTWMIFWMHRQSRFLSKSIEKDVRAALDSSSRRALFGVAFLAVFREGIELALFLVAAGFATSPLQELSGALLGLSAAIILGWVLFTSTRRLPLGNFFLVTNILLVLFAAGLFAHGIGEFNEVGWIPPIVEHVYNISPILNESSIVGQMLKALFGYNSAPSLTEIAAYLAYFAILLPGLFRFHRQLAVSGAQSS